MLTIIVQSAGGRTVFKPSIPYCVVRLISWYRVTRYLVAGVQNIDIKQKNRAVQHVPCFMLLPTATAAPATRPHLVSMPAAVTLGLITHLELLHFYLLIHVSSTRLWRGSAFCWALSGSSSHMFKPSNTNMLLQLPLPSSGSQ